MGLSAILVLGLRVEDPLVGLACEGRSTWGGVPGMEYLGWSTWDGVPGMEYLERGTWDGAE